MSKCGRARDLCVHFPGALQSVSCVACFGLTLDASTVFSCVVLMRALSESGLIYARLPPVSPRSGVASLYSAPAPTNVYWRACARPHDPEARCLQRRPSSTIRSTRPRKHAENQRTERGPSLAQVARSQVRRIVDHGTIGVLQIGRSRGTRHHDACAPGALAAAVRSTRRHTAISSRI